MVVPFRETFDTSRDRREEGQQIANSRKESTQNSFHELISWLWRFDEQF